MQRKRQLNSKEDQIPIDYAYGWAFSAGDSAHTMQTLLDQADSCMYENKQLCKDHKL